MFTIEIEWNGKVYKRTVLNEFLSGYGTRTLDYVLVSGKKHYWFRKRDDGWEQILTDKKLPIEFINVVTEAIDKYLATQTISKDLN
jgi:hypothetical protein